MRFLIFSLHFYCWRYCRCLPSTQSQPLFPLSITTLFFVSLGYAFMFLAKYSRNISKGGKDLKPSSRLQDRSHHLDILGSRRTWEIPQQVARFSLPSRKRVISSHILRCITAVSLCNIFKGTSSSLRPQLFYCKESYTTRHMLVKAHHLWEPLLAKPALFFPEYLVMGCL